MMKRYSVLFYGILPVLLLLTAGRAEAQLRIRLKPYLGIGAAGIQSRRIADLVIEDEYDQLYFDRNYKRSPGLSLRGTARADLLHFYDLSFGYQFWAHRHIYPDELPDNDFKVGVDYPSEFSISMHTVTVQWTLQYKYISSSWFVPFITAGYGFLFGTAKSHHYEWITTDETVADRFYDRTAEYEGNGIMAGIGAVLFKYVFIHLNLVDLQDRTIPHNKFLELTIGGTI